MITSVTLAQGAVRMAAKESHRQRSCEYAEFWQYDILCSDKTGTLTAGNLILDRHVDPLEKLPSGLSNLSISTAFFRLEFRTTWMTLFKSAQAPVRSIKPS